MTFEIICLGYTWQNSNSLSPSLCKKINKRNNQIYCVCTLIHKLVSFEALHIMSDKLTKSTLTDYQLNQDLFYQRPIQSLPEHSVTVMTFELLLRLPEPWIKIVDYPECKDHKRVLSLTCSPRSIICLWSSCTSMWDSCRK